METILYVPSEKDTQPSHALTVVSNSGQPTDSRSNTAPSPFIEANTIEGTLEEIKQQHIIPVFIKDNEPVISQSDFIQTTMEVVHNVFAAERILTPSIRLSHPIKGRVPEAKDKAARELLEWEKTLYYERMAFIIEVPSIRDTIDGQGLFLTIGGIKAHNLDNLYQKKGAEEHFKVFIGFKVSVCTNLCVWCDGLASSVKVKHIGQLKAAISSLITSFDAIGNLKQLERLQQYGLSEQQFAQLIGRCRMYQYLPAPQKKQITELKFHDTQIAAICRDYYRDNSFCKSESGDINLWRLYNLFTTANKQSYIDRFLDRAVNASGFVAQLADAIEQKEENWFLS